MEEIVLQNPGVVLLPKDSFGKRTAAKLGFRLPMEVHGGADTHLQPVEDPHTGAGACPKEPVTLWEACAGEDSWQDLWTCGERSPQSRFSGRTCDPVGDPHWSSLCLKDCSPWKGPMLEQFVKNCSPGEGLTMEKFVKDCGGTPYWSRGRV